MRSKATSVEAYLAELPDDRRDAVRALREVILKNLDKDYEEGVQYGAIGYYVPHRVFPAGYHCDPRQPLPFAGLASQKNSISLHLMCLYMDADETEWFQKAWAGEVAKGRAKKLDMGKACVRIKKLEDVPLGVIGQAIKRMPAKKYIAYYEATLAGMGRGTRPRKTTEAAADVGAAKAPKKTVKKTVKKAAQGKNAGSKSRAATATRAGARAGKPASRRAAGR